MSFAPCLQFRVIHVQLLNFIALKRRLI